ncbi:Acetate kinase [Pseudodesulfovibrio hydrargyri]|uniref:Acetate kinase n=1 Tax=Pseudodesulfovibrio hydrargyri TaxID=2125990 RepID=A0A1J5MV81_9BACT|nr:acetate kinase [Pseudodesulfovibrio hydrargyri]OIQ50502.1 Acetate kinase [Pseudodesulfovibrio hydrargyri]
MKILVINCGSSSLKYQLRDMNNETVMATGLVERIGGEIGRIAHTSRPDGDSPAKRVDELPIADHTEALKLMTDRLLDGVIDSLGEIDAIGHRVVQGGESFSHPVLVDDAVVETIRANIPLAPLHESNTIGIEQARKLFGDVPNVTVFDTEFHLTMPPHAYMYPLPMELYDDLKIRKYGFHGTSHKFVSRAAAEHLGKKPEEVNLITLHLGNGCSMDAVEKGKCVDTTMGLTPLAGLMMGSRCGDIDPAIVPFLAKNKSLSLDEIDALMNHQSGLLGICGMNDMRDVHQAREQGDENAQLAFEMFAYRAKKTVGSFLAVLGTVDALVFTAGVGENDDHLRAKVCEGLAPLGIHIDTEKNAVREPGIREIHAAGSPVKILIVPTNEELEIARSTMAVVNEAAA